MVGRGGLPFTPEQADAIARRDGLAAAVGQRGVGQDLRVERALRALGAGGRRRAGADPGDHVHRQGGGGAAHARAGAVRGAGAARPRARPRRGLDLHVPRALRAGVRAHAVRAGLDPAFGVWRSPRRATYAARVRARAGGFLAGDRPRRWTSSRPTASTGWRSLIGGVHDQLRSGGHDAAALPPCARRGPPRRARSPRSPRGRGRARRPVTRAAESLAGARRCAASPAFVREARAGLAAAPRRPHAAFKAGNTKALKSERAPTTWRGWRPSPRVARRARRRHGHAARQAVRPPRRHLRGRQALARRRWTSTTSSCWPATCCATRPPSARLRESASQRVMVDEFQDTNAAAARPVRAVGRGALVVGDELQSIYGFRHADVRHLPAHARRWRRAARRPSWR